MMTFLKIQKESILLMVFFYILCFSGGSNYAGGLEVEGGDGQKVDSFERSNCFVEVVHSEYKPARKTVICFASHVQNATSVEDEWVDHHLSEELRVNEENGVIVVSDKANEDDCSSSKATSEQSQVEHEKTNENLEIGRSKIYDLIKIDKDTNVKFYQQEIEGWPGYGAKYFFLALLGGEEVFTTSRSRPSIIERYPCHDLELKFADNVNTKSHKPILNFMLMRALISDYIRVDGLESSTVYPIMSRHGYDVFSMHEYCKYPCTAYSNEKLKRIFY